jgi:hypothetical protein
MAKRTGLGQRFFLDGYDLSGDVGSLDSVSTTINPLVTTGINKEAFERIAGLRDGQLSFMAFFNPASLMSHDRLSNLPSTPVAAMYLTGTTIGNPAAMITGPQVSYDGNRSDDGSFTFKTAIMGDKFALEWGRLLTAGRSTLSSAGAITSYDYGAAIGTTNFGFTAYLQVFAFTGTSATVAIQSSTDNGAGDAFANVTGGAFAAASAVGTQRIITSTTQAVERYLRVNVTGTFSALDFAVVLIRNETTPVI